MNLQGATEMSRSARFSGSRYKWSSSSNNSNNSSLVRIKLGLGRTRLVTRETYNSPKRGIRERKQRVIQKQHHKQQRPVKNQAGAGKNTVVTKETYESLKRRNKGAKRQD